MPNQNHAATPASPNQNTSPPAINPQPQTTTATTAPTPPHAEPFSSPDGLVKITTKVSHLQRWPAHDYPCVVTELRPKIGTRGRALQPNGVEVMFTHEEVRALLTALNRSAGTDIYVATQIKGKPPDRVEFWRRRNDQRHAAAKSGSYANQAERHVAQLGQPPARR